MSVLSKKTAVFNLLLNLNIHFAWKYNIYFLTIFLFEADMAERLRRLTRNRGDLHAQVRILLAAIVTG